jgi:AraC-like DNA-binding protein
MKSSASHLPDLQEIRRLSSLIPDPTNYYNGAAGSWGVQPENILCFARHHAAGLLGAQQSSHQHHRCVLVTALNGTGRLCLDADNFILHEGQSQLIAPFQFHSYMDVQPEQICWIFVTFELSLTAGIEPLSSSRPRTLGPTEWILLREIIHCWLQADRHALLSLHLGLLLARLLTIGPAASSPSHRNLANPGADLIAELNSYVLPRLDQPLGLTQLAHALGHSESHLRAKFRKTTGGGLGGHLRRLRVQKACRLLRLTGLRIGAIADQCGFDSVYSFSRTFKTACGISPRAYRQGAPLNSAVARESREQDQADRET